MGFDKTLTNSNLIKLLKALTIEEWKDFEKFVGSPYFNEGRNYMPLIKILKKFHPEFQSEDFSKKEIYKKLFPGKIYKENVLSTMFSRLYNIGEKYLIHVAINKNENMIKEKLIIKELRSRGIMLKLDKQITDNLRFFKDKKFESSDFKNLYEIYLEVYKLNQINNKSDIVYGYHTGLIKYLLYNFFYESNLYLSSLYSQKNFWKENFDKSFVSRIYELINYEKIFAILEKEDYKNIFPVKLSFLSYMATKYPEKDNYFYELKNLYSKSSDNLGEDLKEIILNNLWGICSMKMLLGKRNFKFEAFEIRKIIVEENILLLIDEYMKIGDFRSTFINAMNVAQIEWGENFLNNHLNKVHLDFREGVKNYCNAWISFERKEFDKALDYAGKVNINQITFKLDMKNITSRIYYESNSTESLYSLLNSYYQLVNNSDSKNKDYLSRHKKFIKHLRKLTDIKQFSVKKSDIEMLKINVEKENVSAKSWLLNKINEIHLK